MNHHRPAGRSHTAKLHPSRALDAYEDEHRDQHGVAHLHDETLLRRVDAAEEILRELQIVEEKDKDEYSLHGPTGPHDAIVAAVRQRLGVVGLEVNAPLGALGITLGEFRPSTVRRRSDGRRQRAGRRRDKGWHGLMLPRHLLGLVNEDDLASLSQPDRKALTQGEPAIHLGLG